jgi:hypothetical protein
MEDEVVDKVGVGLVVSELLGRVRDSVKKG